MMMMKMGRKVFYLSVIWFLVSHVVLKKCDAFWMMKVPATGTKCVSEELQSNVVVLADYVVVSEKDHPHLTPTIAAKVTSPYGNNLYNKENTTNGQFAFTTKEAGNYVACFWVDGHNPGGGDVSANLDWRTGIAAKDWESVARKEKIEGVELELRKLEVAVEAIHENLLYFKSREAEMRMVSESTNSRVEWLSMMSLGVCITISTLKLWHLEQFFQNKKLIWDESKVGSLAPQSRAFDELLKSTREIKLVEETTGVSPGGGASKA